MSPADSRSGYGIRDKALSVTWTRRLILLVQIIHFWYILILGLYVSEHNPYEPTALK